LKIFSGQEGVVNGRKAFSGKKSFKSFITKIYENNA
jgi:hypothetical protein